MPIGLILRLLARLALARAMTRRGAPPAWRTPGQQPSGPDVARTPAGRAGALTRWLAARMGAAVDVARIVLHLVAVMAFLAAAGTLLTAGTTLTTLGPRWVGIIFLVLAAVAALVATGEFRVTLRLRRAWRQRRSAERLRQAGI